MPLPRSGRREDTCTHMSNYQTCSQRNLRLAVLSLVQAVQVAQGFLRKVSWFQVTRPAALWSPSTSFYSCSAPRVPSLLFSSLTAHGSCTVVESGYSCKGTSYRVTTDLPSQPGNRAAACPQSRSRKYCRENKEQGLRRVGL